jgi:hypothetical protein
MSLQLDMELREIYFNVNGGYMSMEKLYRKAKEEGVPGKVYQQGEGKGMVTNITHLYPQTIPKTLQNPKEPS